jgi:hypothetical protein
MTAAECSLDKKSRNQGGNTQMAIRKLGNVTGQVTGIEDPDRDQDNSGSIRAVAGSHAWESGDDQELGAENTAADQGGDTAQDG